MTNLPDNCTQDDIDRAFGGVATCVECGRTFAAGSDDSQDESWTCRKCARAIARQDED